MATMNDIWKDGSNHEACEVCKFCIECGDCKKYGCRKNKRGGRVGKWQSSRSRKTLKSS